MARISRLEGPGDIGLRSEDFVMQITHYKNRRARNSHARRALTPRRFRGDLPFWCTRRLGFQQPI